MIFERLAREQLDRIVELQVAGLRRRVAANGVTLELTEEARHRLADEGYDPAYGARPLKRVLQKRLQDPLALRMLGGEVQPGDHVVAGAGPDGGIAFEVVRAQAEQPVEAS